MPRSFVAFDDSYRVPVPVNVSRAVSCGGTVHICGQLHTDGTGRVQVPGNLVGQTEGAMRRLYEVFGHAGLDGADMAQLQARSRIHRYRGPSAGDSRRDDPGRLRRCFRLTRTPAQRVGIE